MPPFPGWTRIRINVAGDPANESEEDGLRWHWKCCGFGVYDWVDEPVRAIEIPHWSVVLPLTALSAYLLLTKPRKATKEGTSELIPNEDA